MTQRFWAAPRHWLARLLRSAFDVWVQAQVFPQPLSIDRSAPVCYVLPHASLSDSALLDSITRRWDVPRSHEPMLAQATQNRSAYFSLRQTQLTTVSPRLGRLIEAVSTGVLPDVNLIPVSIFWGRTPEREIADGEKVRWLRAWAAEGWGGRSRLRKLVAFVFFRQDVIVKFDSPVSLKQLLQQSEVEGLTLELTQRRVARVLRTRFRTEREAAIGPDLSHRRILADAILQDPLVKQAIAAEIVSKKSNEYKVTHRAEKIIREIAADYSYPIIRVFARALKSVWNRIYDGVTVLGADRLHALAKEHTLVYVPCHRSHIDYLLLSYVVRESGLTIPHIAAGANLNLPIVGSILRGGGAFFLRRSIKDDPLYSEVFSAYVHEVLKRGFPIEYFVEGGRSRTGRLLQPKAGMISMTVQSFLREHSRPLVFIPVYVGYEKLIEGGSYTQELAGKSKRKESLGGLLSTISDLRKAHYGKVGVSFGKPIALGELLDAAGAGSVQDWVSNKNLRRRTLTELSRRIAEGINASVQVNPVALVATALLATPKHAADASQLAHLVDRLRSLVSQSQVVPEMTMTQMTGALAIEYTSKLGYLEKRAHILGDVVLAKEAEAVSLTYFRNNVLHCFALPGVLACLILQHGAIGRGKLTRLARELYVLVESELYLPVWDDDDLTPFTPLDATLDALVSEHWVVAQQDASVYSAPAADSDAAFELEMLAGTIRPTLTRHALMLAIVVRDLPGKRSREAVESLCQQAAQHLAMTHVFNAPEFSDKTQFRSAFDALLRAGLVTVDPDNWVHYLPSLHERANDSGFLLPTDTRAAVLRAARHSQAATP
jgi:glycerol-3-phosphate O-acyltransferase